MTLFEFMSDSPWLSFFIIFIVGQVFVFCIRFALRCLNIRNHGWPPSHCDADGDLKDGEE